MPLKGFKNEDISRKESESIPEVILCVDQFSSAIKPEPFSEEENDIYIIKGNHTEENLSLKEHPYAAERVSVKSEPDDFGNRRTEVDQDLNQTSTIKGHSHIKSEEEDFINNQYLISHEEVNIKSEDEVEQSDTQLEIDEDRHKTNDQLKIHKCPDCPFQSKYKRVIKIHSLRHKKPDEIVWHCCTTCSYKTFRKWDLKVHAAVHKTQNFEIFKCSHCVFETTWKQSLKKHLLSHRGENIAQIQRPAPKCPYKTQDMTQLNSDSWVHNKEKFFKCTRCPYQAKRQEYLKKHQLKHESSDQWHACSQCSFRTTRKSNLKRHVYQIHTNPDQLGQ